ncbi:MAG: peptidoglycan DD-metalloendopeptidase family protein [Povalibacter sp.]
MARVRRCPSIQARYGCRWPLIVVLTLMLAGCASSPSSSGTYIVRRGDTLYSIAAKHHANLKELARWNGIGRDYVIYPGQILKLNRSAKAHSGPAQSTPSATPPRSAAVVIPSGPAISWQWPVEQGTATLTTRPNGGQGLTIAGSAGQDIRAASSGRVVYTGKGLLGYGQLVIIKHNETYLTAYGHTQAVTVREGDLVSAGQRIATMGNGPQGTPMLYFEIRINGTPSNPLSLLPQRR